MTSPLPPERRTRVSLGLIAIATGVAFNLPYIWLAANFEYPGILREPPGMALDRFVSLGSSVVLAWYAFMLTALLFVPTAAALTVTAHRLRSRPTLSIVTVVVGAAAGLAQAIGLARWVFVVPMLASIYADPSTTAEARAAAENAFALLNAFGGVAIGENLGQSFTALFAFGLAALQAYERQRVPAALGLLAGLFIAGGTFEGVALAIRASGDLFSLLTIIGYGFLTLWLIATGIFLIARPAVEPLAR